METIIVNNIEMLYQECKDHEINIYGAKTVAVRTYYYLTSRDIHVDAFLVSNRYKNPDFLLNKPVIRIEECSKHYDGVVLAVSRDFIWDVEEELRNYPINKLIIISPTMDDKFPTCCLLSNRTESMVSPRAFLEEKIQIVVDETSTIIIEDNVWVKEGTIVFAMNHSYIHLHKGVQIGESCFVSADNYSTLELFENVCFGVRDRVTISGNSKIRVEHRAVMKNDCFLEARENSQIRIGYDVDIGMDSEIHADRDSGIFIDEKNSIGKSAYIYLYRNGQINIGKSSSFGNCLSMVVERSSIQIGEDNMFSFFVKMASGNHQLIDKKERKDITNRNPIVTGNHVWVGMGATLMPGCKVGNNSVVGAAAVVTKNIPDNTACVGNPAHVIRTDVDWNRDDSQIKE